MFVKKQSSARDVAESTIADNTVAMFAKTYCGYCRRAKNLLQSEYPEAQVKIVQLDTRDDGRDIQRYLEEKTGQYTVPNIFIHQRHIGGCDELLSLHSRGKLAHLVNPKPKAKV